MEGHKRPVHQRKSPSLVCRIFGRKIDVSQGKVELLRHLRTKYMSMAFYVC